MQSWLSRDPRYHTERLQESEGLTQEKAAELMRTRWMDPAGGPEAARPLAHILHDLGPPPPPHGPAPPGLGDGPPPAPEERAAIEDTRQEEEEATRPTATPTASAIPEPRQDSRDDLESKVADLQRAVERNEELVSDYRKYCDELEGQNQQCFMIISELTNEAKELRKEVEMYSGRMNLVCQDVVALKHQVASLQQELAWRTSRKVNT